MIWITKRKICRWTNSADCDMFRWEGVVHGKELIVKVLDGNM